MLEQKIEQKVETLWNKMKTLVGKKLGVPLLFGSLALGTIAGCSEQKKCDPYTYEGPVYNYCVDYAGKQQCYSGSYGYHCECFEESSACECHCYGSDNDKP